MNKPTDCEGECRYTYGPSFSTMAYYHPVYDKNGNNVNPDMNTSYGSVSCTTCNRKWSTATCNGHTKYTELL